MSKFGQKGKDFYCFFLSVVYVWVCLDGEDGCQIRDAMSTGFCSNVKLRWRGDVRWFITSSRQSREVMVVGRGNRVNGQEKGRRASGSGSGKLPVLSSQGERLAPALACRLRFHFHCCQTFKNALYQKGNIIIIYRASITAISLMLTHALLTIISRDSLTRVRFHIACFDYEKVSNEPRAYEP